MIELQTLSADDWQIWRELRLRSLEQDEAVFDSRLTDWLENDTEELWRAHLGQEDSRYLAAYVDGDQAGMAAGVLRSAQVADLIALWVAPDFRGTGIGEHLVGSVLAWAGDTSAVILRLVVVDTNEDAMRLFERCGFAFDGGAIAGKRIMSMKVSGKQEPDSPDSAEPPSR